MQPSYKGETSKEVESNLESDSSEEELESILIGDRNEEDEGSTLKGDSSEEIVEPNLWEHSEELNQNFQEQYAKHEEFEATIRGLHGKLQIQYIEKEQVEKNLCGRVDNLQKKSEELGKKLEEKDSELGRVEMELKRRNAKDTERQQIEAAFRNKLKETQRRNKNTKSHFKEVANILNIKNEEVDRNLQELLRMQQVKERDWNSVEAALRGQVEQLKK